MGEGPAGLPGGAGVSSSDAWDILREFKVHLLRTLAAVLYELMATISLAVERSPSRRGPGIRSDRADPP